MELKPCPFCGERLDRHERNDNCYLMMLGTGKTDAELDAAWNHRVTEDIMMDEMMARVILGDAFGPDNSLRPVGPLYIMWPDGDNGLTIDGENVSAETLQAVVWWITNMKVPLKG